MDGSPEEEAAAARSLSGSAEPGTSGRARPPASVGRAVPSFPMGLDLGCDCRDWSPSSVEDQGGGLALGSILSPRERFLASSHCQEKSPASALWRFAWRELGSTRSSSLWLSSDSGCSDRQLLAPDQ